MSIGANLRRIRTDRGMSQKELSSAVNVSQPMIAQIERGTKSMTLELGKEIAMALNVQIDKLLEEESQMT